MHTSSLPNLFTALCVYFHVLLIIATSQPENIAISCGSSGITTAPDGRLWIGDSGLESPITLTIDGNPSKRRVIDKFNSPDSMPYASARISRREYHYIFQVNPGHKFIRLHFNHDSYKGFEMSKPAFTVKAGPFTLLSTVNSVLGSDASGVKQVKEYCVNIENGQALTITFSPAQKTKKSDDLYAFVNGIEVEAMPTGLYFTPEGELGPRVVGQKYRFYIYNNTALETVQRLDVTELSISPADDLMFRSLGENSKYLLDKGAVSAYVIRVGYRSTKTYIAPTEVYQTVRSTYANSMLSLNKLTWRIPVDLGFRYLIRLHFSAFQPKMAQTGNREFYVVVNDHIAEDSTDVIQTGEASQLAVSRDYIVMMEGDKMAGKRNLTITMQSKFEPGNEKFHCIPSGLEVLKLSNPDNNLAGMEPFPESPSSISTKPQRKKQRLFTHNLIATMLTVLLALLNIAVYHLRRASDSNPGMMSVRQSTEHPCRQFSVDEIRSATDNFNPEYGIGSGGYGRVYKGTIDGGATVVAVKRLRSESNQGDNEFWTEIKMLSKIRHQHLVSLIGYCNDGQERLLVYQYMSRGTLSDHFFKADKHGKFNPFLPWKVRLKVSIGAARGLNYLHSKHKVIHRDVKSSNILLDENWDAKISDFGLSKMGPTDDSFTHISTNVKGTFGYLDPEYFVNRKLTRKSDVYAFGVVLFEVLSGRPAIASRLEGEERSLAGWAQYCIREGKVDRLIERSMAEQISPACLKVFVGVAGRCLDRQPQGRPAMADVVTGLELALALQQNHVSEEWVEGEESADLQ